MYVCNAMFAPLGLDVWTTHGMSFAPLLRLQSLLHISGFRHCSVLYVGLALRGHFSFARVILLVRSSDVEAAASLHLA